VDKDDVPTPIVSGTPYSQMDNPEMIASKVPEDIKVRWSTSRTTSKKGNLYNHIPIYCICQRIRA